MTINPNNAQKLFYSFRQFVLIVSILLSLPTFADELTNALTAYEEGNYTAAHEQFTQLAFRNNTEAQYNLAFMYFGGDGIPKNDAKAAYLFEKAAKLAHSGAQDKLAYFYLHGLGVNADQVQAYAWYRVAAENGVFLAENISKSLKQKMNTEEAIHADLLSVEYIKKYKEK